MVARAGWWGSVDRRLANRRAEVGFQEVEVAAFMRLADVLGVHVAITTLEPRCRRRPRGFATSQFLIRNPHVDAASGNIDLDDVAGAEQRQRSSDERLRRNMQHAGAIAG